MQQDFQLFLACAERIRWYGLIEYLVQSGILTRSYILAVLVKKRPSQIFSQLDFRHHANWWSSSYLESFSPVHARPDGLSSMSQTTSPWGVTSLSLLVLGCVLVPNIIKVSPFSSLSASPQIGVYSLDPLPRTTRLSLASRSHLSLVRRLYCMRRHIFLASCSVVKD